MSDEQQDNQDIHDQQDNQGALRLLEAILFASAEPLPVDMLQKQLGKEADIPALLKELQDHYAQHGVNLVEIDGMWGFRTAPDLAGLMKIVRQPRRKLPRAASEVLAIIAYHQPVTRAEIESIRGVDTNKGTLDILLELGWIRPGKRRETPGKPLNWHTTSEFLGHFNISSLEDLPGLEDLKAAGMLDTRLVLNDIAREKDGAGPTEPEDDDFAVWVSEEPEKAAAGS
ncbi:MAG: SMC-Scp complex subunit ScpB [Bdellovibrionales bacterium]